MQQRADRIREGDEIHRRGEWHKVTEILEMIPPLPLGQTLEIKTGDKMVAHLRPDEMVEVRSSTD
jgi:hypothetical protein